MAKNATPRKLVTKRRAVASPAVASVSLNKNLVFISHDSRDAELAELFANLLTDVSAGMLKSFRSSDKRGTSGIEFGAEWYSTIMSQLDQASDVVALLTKNSIDRPWILYEAGVAKGKLETTVFGIALGVPLATVSAGPFGQFQNCDDDGQSLTKLVMQLIKRNPEASPREEAVKLHVDSFKQKLKEILSKRGDATVQDEEGPASAKLFEEIKAMFRELPEVIGERVSAASRRSVRRRNFHPMMLEEMMFRAEEDGGSASWLVFISELRSDLPWLYEAGLPLYRALQARNRSAAKKAADDLMKIIRTAKDSPITRMREDKETYYIMRGLDEIVYNIVSRMPENSRHGADKDDVVK